MFSLGEEEEKKKGLLELTMEMGEENGEVVVVATMMSMLSVLDMVVGVLVASLAVRFALSSSTTTAVMMIVSYR